jgi:hypothetical protein
MPIRALLLMGDAHQLHDRPFHYAELAGILAGEASLDLRVTRDLGVLHSSELEHAPGRAGREVGGGQRQR